MTRGIVKWYSEARGRGLIIPDSGGAEIGVACTDVAAEGFCVLYEGQRVKFDVVQTARGLKAKNVTECEGE
jgi:cold shock protein